jgi:hypothetical protein
MAGRGREDPTKVQRQNREAAGGPIRIYGQYLRCGRVDLGSAHHRYRPGGKNDGRRGREDMVGRLEAVSVLSRAHSRRRFTGR